MDTHDPGRDGERHPPQNQHMADFPAGRSGFARWDLATVSLILIVLAVWMLAHPYRGIVHDNRIYALLAFNFLDPTAFARDLFLKHGSQDSFTIFSPLYAGAITLLGLDWSTKLLVIIGQALWILGAFALVRKMVAPRFTWLALLFLAAYPTYYGGNSVFGVGEGFLTPRLYTEALGLFAIAAFLNARLALASILVVLGGLLHPLMMAAPAAVILLLALLRNRPWWMPTLVVATGSLLILAAMAAIHSAGLSILPAIDPEWRSVVRHRTGQLMLANWTPTDWIMIASDVIVVCLACIRATPLIRQLLVTVIAVGLASLVTSFVAFDLLGDVMTGQAQVWRALWLLHVMSPIALALLVQDIVLRADPDRKYLLFLAFAYSIVTYLCEAAGLPPFGVSILILLGTFYVRTQSGQAVTTPRDRLMIRAGMGLLLAIILVQVLSSLLSPSGSLPTDGMALLRIALVSVLLAVGGTLVFDMPPGRRQLFATLAAISLVAGVLQWDARGAWRRYMDTAPDIASELSVPVAHGELVYWPADVTAMWVALRNPSFYSDVQGAGAIFNRDTALAFLRRLNLVSAFEPYVPWKDGLAGKKAIKFDGDGIPDVGIDDLVALCTKADRPDVVVLSQDIAGARREVWRPPVPYTRVYAAFSQDDPDNPELVVGQTDAFYFYRCQDFGTPALGQDRNPPSGRGETSLAMMQTGSAVHAHER